MSLFSAQLFTQLLGNSFRTRFPWDCELIILPANINLPNFKHWIPYAICHDNDFIYIRGFDSLNNLHSLDEKNNKGGRSGTFQAFARDKAQGKSRCREARGFRRHFCGETFSLELQPIVHHMAAQVMPDSMAMYFMVPLCFGHIWIPAEF